MLFHYLRVFPAPTSLRFWMVSLAVILSGCAVLYVLFDRWSVPAAEANCKAVCAEQGKTGHLQAAGRHVRCECR